MCNAHALVCGSRITTLICVNFRAPIKVKSSKSFIRAVKRTEWMNGKQEAAVILSDTHKCRALQWEDCVKQTSREKRHIFIVLNEHCTIHIDCSSGEKRAHTIERFGDSCHSQQFSDMWDRSAAKESLYIAREYEINKLVVSDFQAAMHCIYVRMYAHRRRHSMLRSTMSILSDACHARALLRRRKFIIIINNICEPPLYNSSERRKPVNFTYV